MNPSDFQFIESRLNVVLPEIFKQFMRGFPNDPLHRITFDSRVRISIDAALPVNAELFVITQLQHFNNDHEIDYYEITPDHRSRSFIYLGDDGCGNFYCMVGNDPQSNELWMWEHDPPNGFSIFSFLTLQQYLCLQWQLETQPDPFAAFERSGRTVTRADHPLLGVLRPIERNQWYDYIARDDELELDEIHTIVNPFTKEPIPTRRWPGRARLTAADSPTYFAYSHGCISLAPPAIRTPNIDAKLQQLAEHFGAGIF